MVEGAGQCADLLYRSKFLPVDPVVFLDEGKRRTLVVPMLEFGRAVQEARGVEVVLPEAIGVDKAKSRSLSGWAVALLRYRKVKTVRVGPFFPAALLRALEEDGVRVDIMEKAMYPERAVKTPEELARIIVSQKAAVRAMREAEKVLRAATITRSGFLRWQGRALTAEALRTVIDIALLHEGCLARDTIVAGGAQAADPHERGSGPLKAGTSIVIDIFPQHKRSGYWGDITRTFCCGSPSPALARMYATVLKAQKLALSLIRPGVCGSVVHQRISDYFVAEGYPTTVKDGVVRGFFHGTGHGVGLDIHEGPWLNRLENKLAVGQVVTVEPGLYDPDIGGVRIEDTVVIEAGGPRLLATYPKTFVMASPGGAS